MKSLFIICQHGDEKSPLEVIKKYFDKKIEYLIAHPHAVKIKKRFIETDLNRSFPGKIDGSLEENLAIKILKKTFNFNEIVDIHTASCETDIFTIITKITKQHLNLARRTGVKKIVYMQDSIASGNALIDHVPVGISVESGKEGESITKIRIKQVIDHFIAGNKIKNCDFYIVYKILKKQNEEERLLDSIHAFKYIKKGNPISKIGGRLVLATENFYPIMPRAASYKGVLCLMARKISLFFVGDNEDKWKDYLDTQIQKKSLKIQFND